MTEYQKILHLHRRAGFGLAPEHLPALKNKRLDQEIHDLWQQAEAVRYLPQIDLTFVGLPIAERNKQRDAFLRGSALAIQQTRLQWMNQMGDPAVSGLREKMTLFWHGHFATQIRFAHNAVNQNNMLRKHALGNFGDLLRGIAKDPAMLEFLNNNANRKGRINENFGRELLELFSLGIGNYTHKDIVNVSRAFSGYTHKEHAEFFMYENDHDPGPKEFLGKKGDFTGDDIVEILLQQKQTSRFIVTKIYKFLVSPLPNPARTEALTELFFRSKFEIRPLLDAIFSAPWFYEPQVVGALIKSPVELLAGMMRVFHLRFDQSEQLARFCDLLGQQLFQPPNVAGWPGGESWISTYSIFRRLNTALYIGSQVKEMPEKLLISLGKPGNDFSGISLNSTADFNPLLQVFSKVKATKFTATLAGYLLPVALPEPLPSRTVFDTRKEETLSQAIQFMSLPEYQIT